MHEIICQKNLKKKTKYNNSHKKKKQKRCMLMIFLPSIREIVNRIKNTSAYHLKEWCHWYTNRSIGH